MRIIQFQSARGLFATSGGYKSNLAVLRHLASIGHVVQQVVFAYEKELKGYAAEQKSKGTKVAIRRETLRIPGVNKTVVKIRVAEFRMADGVRVVALDADDVEGIFPCEELRSLTRSFVEEEPLPPSFRALIVFLGSVTYRFNPTHVVFNDSLPLKLTSLMKLPARVRRIFVIHTAEQLPFGPYAGGIPGAACSPKEHDLLRGVHGIWSVSRKIQEYAAMHGDLSTTFIFHHPWNYFVGPKQELPRRRWNEAKTTILMINPCPVKGSDILIGLARRCPEFEFVALCSWGTDENPKVRKELESITNLTLKPSTRDMEAVWDSTRVLLMPSLWCEAWGLVVVEAQIRGIPVLSSDAGAIPEAKLGLPHIIPVKPLLKAKGDPKGHPDFDVPAQDIDAWVEALTKVMTDQEEYKRLSDMCADVTGKWALNLDARAHEKWMLEMMPSAKETLRPSIREMLRWRQAPKKDDVKAPSGNKQSDYLYCIPPGKLHKITEANIL